MPTSHQLFEQAQRCIPGGVNSPVRAFKGVGGEPVFIARGEGAYLYDVEGKAYVDYIGSWGPLILGHGHPCVIDAVTAALHRGMSFGAPTEMEVQLAEKVIHLMAHIEKIRMVSSGTEATMTAIRLARGFTNKTKLIKFEGCYHGHSDSLLVKAGSGLLTLGLPACLGILPSIAEHTLVARFNDLEHTAQLFSEHPQDIAAIIVEPIAGNMGLVMPTPGFLQGLRALCDTHDAVLIFDEVMTGFRVALGGAQALYAVKPDLTTLGKVIGGGMPVGAVGGRADIMDTLAPLGGVYQAGTLSGNPLAMAAGLATLTALEKPGFFNALTDMTKVLVDGLCTIAADLHVPFTADSIGGMFGFFFKSGGMPRNYQEVSSADDAFFRRFYHHMLQEGIYLAPSSFEAGFVSSAHQMIEIQKTLLAFERALHHSLHE